MRWPSSTTRERPVHCSDFSEAVSRAACPDRPPPPPPDRMRTAGSCDRASVEKYGLSPAASGPTFMVTDDAGEHPYHTTASDPYWTDQWESTGTPGCVSACPVRDSVNSPVLMHNSSQLVLQMFTGVCRVGADVLTSNILQQSQIIWIMSSFFFFFFMK